MVHKADVNAVNGAALLATNFMKTFLDYPQRQTPGSFNVDRIIEQLEAARGIGQ